MILQPAEGTSESSFPASWLSVQHSPRRPHPTLLLPVQCIHSVTNQGGGELRQAPTEIGCCLCVIMLLWEPQWVCFLRSLLKSFAWLGFSPSTDTVPLRMGSREAEIESCILLARFSIPAHPTQSQPGAASEEPRLPRWFHNGWSEGRYSSSLLSHLGAELLFLLCSHLITNSQAKELLPEETKFWRTLLHSQRLPEHSSPTLVKMMHEKCLAHK